MVVSMAVVSFVTVNSLVSIEVVEANMLCLMLCTQLPVTFQLKQTVVGTAKFAFGHGMKPFYQNKFVRI